MNYVLPFLLEDGVYRGRFVQCETLMDTLFEHHAYPPMVEELLTQAVVVAVLLASSLKYEGLFTLQVQGSGPVTLIVVDVSDDGHVRASVRYDEAKLPKQTASLSDLTGKAVLAFTVDQALSDNERYQGVVELDGSDLTAGVLSYFEKSEHIPTDLVLLTQIKDGHRQAAGLMVQQLPGKTVEPGKDDFETISVLMQSVRKKEVFEEGLSPEQVLFRLFHANLLLLFPKKDIQFECRCSYDKVKKTLAQFSNEQLNDMYEEGVIHVTCQFCGKTYDFKKEDLS